MLNVFARLAVIALVVARTLLGGVDGQVLCLPLVDCCPTEHAAAVCGDVCGSSESGASAVAPATHDGRHAPLHISAPVGAECGCHVHVPLPADDLSVSKHGAGTRPRVEIPALQTPLHAPGETGPVPLVARDARGRAPDASSLAHARALRVTRLLI